MKLLEIKETTIADLIVDMYGGTYTGGDLFLGRQHLTSLEGCPSHVSGSFYCSQNKLRSLKDGPERVDGNFSCSHNVLTSLEGAPSRVGGAFNVHHNKLRSLKGIHRIIKEIGGPFSCHDNPIQDGLEYILLIKGVTLVATDNDLFDLAANAYLNGNPSGSMKAVLEVMEFLES